jgi:adenosine deaminase
MKDHNLRKMLHRGLRVTINSDEVGFLHAAHAVIDA